jgi:hypothetical protein
VGASEGCHGWGSATVDDMNGPGWSREQRAGAVRRARRVRSGGASSDFVKSKRTS